MVDKPKPPTVDEIIEHIPVPRGEKARAPDVDPRAPRTVPSPGPNPERFDTGMHVNEAIYKTGVWWNLQGRFVVRNPEFKDPDIGFASGITRGLSWESLNKREQTNVVLHWHHHFVRIPMMRQAAKEV